MLQQSLYVYENMNKEKRKKQKLWHAVSEMENGAKCMLQLSHYSTNVSAQ